MNTSSGQDNENEVRIGGARMIRDLLLEYGAPVAVSLTLAVGGMAVTNRTDIAVLQSESENMVEVQKEMLVDVKALRRMVYKIDARMEAQYE